ncbi:winged helix-turn-helix transcriptional regulator [Acinetobacter sp. MD2(2019)]|uniref:winged helix-turn-helix transcriptional regulator n=1 Tax=Acinetobacter sp. MD2(2019) TaxID=2605273 RepID=UPI002D1F410A|nr:winged helix-turn-helix transcriptional regulator [Acinetobacter sp. MD2(2019)]MEB3755051.1 helix-turn-helix transcriptional regulator [Acinetobacter sp. MD2(2019)]
MNENAHVMKLIDYCSGNPMPFGNQEGKKVFPQLKAIIDSASTQKVFEISFEGIKFTDSSFARESILLLAKMYRGNKGIYLSHFDPKNVDMLDNWDYAAEKVEQPILVKMGGDIRLLGNQLSSSNKEVFDLVMKAKAITASKVATQLGLSVPNTSTKLKKLVDEGYILRVEEVAESGGIEFIYKSIC